MEHNQVLLKDVLLALRANPGGLLEHMPNKVRESKFLIDLGV